MVIEKDKITFMNGEELKPKPDGFAMDEFLSMMVSLLSACLEHSNRKELLEDNYDMNTTFQVSLEDGGKAEIQVINLDDNMAGVLVNGRMAEKQNEIVLAKAFLENVRRDLNALYSGFEKSPAWLLEMKANIRQELATLESNIERHELEQEY